MITLFQNRARYDMANAINILGWDKAIEKYPSVKSSLGTSTVGSKGYKPEHFEFYTAVCNIDTDSIEESFKIHNNPFGDEALEDKITRFTRQHSMSVGDIIKTESNYYMVDSVGFMPIHVQ
jgi:hypothetical protein|tara:strand:+ start:590 stop:952 length:363 start_codon:yes stop_codon:yes gene_type:complete